MKRDPNVSNSRVATASHTQRCNSQEEEEEEEEDEDEKVTPRSFYRAAFAVSLSRDTAKFPQMVVSQICVSVHNVTKIQ